MTDRGWNRRLARASAAETDTAGSPSVIGGHLPVQSVLGPDGESTAGLVMKRPEEGRLDE